MIQLIPAIDIIDGRCVRLSKGDYDSKKVYDASPLDMAMAYADCGVRRIHLVDLDGAKQSVPVNLQTLEAIASKVDIEIEWGGGISSDAALADAFNAGATCGIIGTVAALKPELFRGWLKKFGPARMILGSDVRDRKVAVKGWLEDTELTIDTQIDGFLPDGLSQVICTDISKDGMLQGPAVALYEDLQSKYPSVDFTVSGGISSMADIETLESCKLRKVIIGKAIYEGRITLADIEKWSSQQW